MRKLKTKTVPCLVMLLGGAVTLIITYFHHYPSRDTLKILLFSLLGCYFVGTMVKTALDRIEIEDETIQEISESEDNGTEMAEERMTDEPEMDVIGDIEDSMDGSNEFVLDESNQDDFYQEDEEAEILEETDEYFEDSSYVG